MEKIKKYIKEGITINKISGGYQVFTIPTQHFNIKDLNELTPDRFKREINNQNDCEELERQLMAEFYKNEL